DIKSLRIQQDLKYLGVQRRDEPGRTNDKFSLFVRRHVVLATQIAALGNQGVPAVYHFDVTIVEAIVTAEVFVQWFRPGRQQDGFVSWVFGHVEIVPHPMPKSLRDERQERMKKAEGM